MLALDILACRHARGLWACVAMAEMRLMEPVCQTCIRAWVYAHVDNARLTGMLQAIT